MWVDGLSAGLRALSFIALFQAAGSAIFLVCFGRQLAATAPFIRRVVIVSGVIAIGLLIGQYLLEAARMGGELASAMDAELQSLALHSPAAAVLACRVLGLALILIAVRSSAPASTWLIGAGVLIAIFAFVLTGHTASHSGRLFLAISLVSHLLAVAFWFGALVPLHVASSREAPAIAGAVTAAFSEAAVRIVPALFVAGLAIATFLLGGLAGLKTPYGQLLIAKIAGFALLMVLATLNKARLGPAVAAADPRLVRSFRLSLTLEWWLIAAVLSVTAVLTTFYSPD